MSVPQAVCIEEQRERLIHYPLDLSADETLAAGLYELRIYPRVTVQSIRIPKSHIYVDSCVYMYTKLLEEGAKPHAELTPLDTPSPRRKRIPHQERVRSL